MSTLVKIGLFVVWCTPFLYFGWVAANFEELAASDEYYNFIRSSMLWKSALLFAGFLVYLVHMRRNTHLSSNSKNNWTTAFILFNYFAFPFYWFKYVLRG